MFLGGYFLTTNHLTSYPRYLSTTSQHPTHHSISTLLKEINNHSLKLHNEVGQALSQLLQYVLIFQGGTLSLWQPAKEGWKHIERVDITNSQYHDYKALAHIPWHIKLILEKNDLEKATELLSHLHQLRILCKASADFAAYSEYIEDSIRVLNHWSVYRNQSQEIESIYKNKYDPIIATLMKMATNEVLSTLDETIKKWLMLHEIDLKRVKIIIASTHGPRSRLAEAQYMENLVKTTLKIENRAGVENVYIYQTEVLPSQLSDGERLEKQLLHELLVPSQVNSMIGSKMMDDPLAMYQDILHQDAEDWLNTQLPKDKSRCPMHVMYRS